MPKFEDDAQVVETDSSVARIEQLDTQLLSCFGSKFVVQRTLSRQMVSFQGNKHKPVSRWYKYKEAFSADLVEYLLTQFGIKRGTILDPFAGIGTALFSANTAGLNAHGIELLPIGQQVIASRYALERDFTTADFVVLEYWIETRPWRNCAAKQTLPVLRITGGAYPAQTVEAIEHYLAALGHENDHIQDILRFALLCILESISYTRKDGQYLRWDHRSGRKQGKRPFNKGEIFDFDRAIVSKLREIVSDSQKLGQNLPLIPVEALSGEIRLYSGSCLEILPTLPDNFYEAIVTSPPYCNRYDYTRTYALELALLGASEQEIVSLRQQLLSCTVENRAKDLTRINPQWAKVIKVADQQELLQAILRYLEGQNELGNLNNKGIPRMVRGYFYEMTCVIAECARVVKKNGYLIMVNDNVRYAGISIPVDLILSDIASQLGFVVEKILVLPGDKGNSSQQMGRHGRDSLRKCVYIWRKG